MESLFMPSNSILLSIRPKYAEKILEGSKTVELRRVRPIYIAKGSLAFMYVTSPVKSIVGAFKVDLVIEMNLRDLWKAVKSRAGISQKEFDSYFEGTCRGVGIFFSEIWLFSKLISLKDLKKKMDFQPPQSFRYAKANELAIPQFTEFFLHPSF